MNLYAWCISMSSIPRQSSIYSKSFPTATYFTHYLFQPCHRLNVLKNVPSAERWVVVSFLTNIFFICGILWSSRFITNTHRATRGKKKEWKKSNKSEKRLKPWQWYIHTCSLFFFSLFIFFFHILFFIICFIFLTIFFSPVCVCVCDERHRIISGCLFVLLCWKDLNASVIVVFGISLWLILSHRIKVKID